MRTVSVREPAGEDQRSETVATKQKEGEGDAECKEGTGNSSSRGELSEGPVAVYGKPTD